MKNSSGPPRFAIGHVPLAGQDIQALAAFYTEIGMRLVVDLGHMAIIELRGGTHIILQSGPTGQGSLDLMVDKIDETREIFIAVGAAVTDISRGTPHDRFDTVDPEGNKLVVWSSHAVGEV